MKPSPAMQTLIAKAYMLFNCYSVPTRFDVCTYCCVTEQEEKLLRQTPLRNISHDLMSTYNQSAKSPHQDANEIRYLLPRLLELVAEHQFPYHSDEICLQRLGAVDTSTWKPAERELLDEFALQFMKDAFSMAEEEGQLIALDDWLIMFYNAGLDVWPLLNLFEQQTGFYAVASVARLVIEERAYGALSNAFASDCALLNQTLNDWLTQPDTRKLLQQHAEVFVADYPGDNKLREQEQYWVEQNLLALQALAF